MAASGELGAFITVVTFLGIITILISTVPNEFMIHAQNYRSISVPEYFESVDITYFAATKNFTLDPNKATGEIYGWYYIDFSLGGHDFTIEWKYPEGIMLKHVEKWWIFVTGRHNMNWYEKRQGSNLGTKLKSEHLTTYYDENRKDAQFIVRCEHTQLSVFFAYNTTKYSDILEAWENNELAVLFGINFDQVNTSYNAWNLVAQILFFQNPDIHPAINALIAIPIWATIAITVYILILKAIPFVGG